MIWGPCWASGQETPLQSQFSYTLECDTTRVTWGLPDSVSSSYNEGLRTMDFCGFSKLREQLEITGYRAGSEGPRAPQPVPCRSVGPSIARAAIFYRDARNVFLCKIS